PVDGETALEVLAFLNRLLRARPAKAIYDILVAHAGASVAENNYQQFRRFMEEGDKEYRFQGLLGYGGKFWNTDGRWFVNCYSEDVTPERAKIIEQTNIHLVKLKATKE